VGSSGRELSRQARRLQGELVGCRPNASTRRYERHPAARIARCLSNRFETNCSIDIERKGGLGPEYWQDFVGLVNVTRKQAD
jgi:hypothetical protein